MAVEKEIESFNHSSACITTSTFYKDWYSGEIRNPEKDSSKVRGDLALKTFKETIDNGYRLVVVDGGSCPEFLAAANELGVSCIVAKDSTMSPSRQQAFEIASEIKGVEAILWTEDSKLSLVQDCLPEILLPILRGDADIVVPHRTPESFATYPNYQVVSEQKGNKKWNEIVRKFGFLKQDQPELDIYFGPKAWKNSPEIHNLFMTSYKLNHDGVALYGLTNLDAYLNATFDPVIAGLANGHRIASVDVDYKHPPEQTLVEKENPVFVLKREKQLKDITIGTFEFCNYLKNILTVKLEPKIKK